MRRNISGRFALYLEGAGVGGNVPLEASCADYIADLEEARNEYHRGEKSV